MSKATQAKTAKGRASEAIRQLRSVKRLGQSFHDCFKNGDLQVVQIIVEKAASDPELDALIRRRGFGHWFGPDYNEQRGIKATHDVGDVLLRLTEKVERLLSGHYAGRRNLPEGEWLDLDAAAKAARGALEKSGD